MGVREGGGGGRERGSPGTAVAAVQGKLVGDDARVVGAEVPGVLALAQDALHEEALVERAVHHVDLHGCGCSCAPTENK